MMSALPLRPSPADLGQVLDVAQWMRQQLRTAYGVTVTSSGRTTGPAARWDPHARTIDFRDGTSGAVMAWAIGQVWTLIVVGPHAITGHRPTPQRPTLRLIPFPRDGR